MFVFIDMIIRNGKKREGRKFRGVVVFTKSRSILFLGHLVYFNLFQIQILTISK